MHTTAVLVAVVAIAVEVLFHRRRPGVRRTSLAAAGALSTCPGSWPAAGALSTCPGSRPASTTSLVVRALAPALGLARLDFTFRHPGFDPRVKAFVPNVLNLLGGLGKLLPLIRVLLLALCGVKPLFPLRGVS